MKVKLFSVPFTGTSSVCPAWLDSFDPLAVYPASEVFTPTPAAGPSGVQIR